MMKMGMRSVALFYILIKIFARATPAEQRPRLMVSFSWEQIAAELRTDPGHLRSASRQERKCRARARPKALI